MAALKQMYDFVGADDLKESFAKSIQYYIVTHATVSVRRSKRKKRAVAKSKTHDSDTEVVECSDSDGDDEEAGDIKDVLFRLMLAEKLQSMLGGDSDSDDEDYDPNESTKKRKRQEYKPLKKLHTCLLGPPGTGKTTFAKLIVDVWDALGIVDGKKFFITGRGDWVAKYHGHSSQKAKKLIKKAKGGVIFIDEAYALIGSASDDMFGSEVLTTIVEAMTSAEKDTVFIMAGYKDKMDRLFKNNSGLERRFSYIYTFNKPTASHMVQIFKTQVKRYKWKLKCSDEEVMAFFQIHRRDFQNAGGSTEKFLDYCQHAAVTRSFPQSPSKKILLVDMKHALDTMKSTNQSMKACSEPPANMYI